MLYYAILYYTILDLSMIMLCYSMLCYSMLCYAMLCRSRIFSASIWGYDCDFTNHDIRRKTLNFCKSHSMSISGKVVVLKFKGFSEIVVGEIVARSPYVSIDIDSIIDIVIDIII